MHCAAKRALSRLRVHDQPFTQSRRPIGTRAQRWRCLPPQRKACISARAPAQHQASSSQPGTCSCGLHCNARHHQLAIIWDRAHLPIQVFGSICIQLGACCQVRRHDLHTCKHASVTVDLLLSPAAGIGCQQCTSKRLRGCGRAASWFPVFLLPLAMLKQCGAACRAGPGAYDLASRPGPARPGCFWS